MSRDVILWNMAGVVLGFGKCRGVLSWPNSD